MNSEKIESEKFQTQTEKQEFKEKENVGTFQKLKQLLDGKKIIYKLMEHEPAKTSEEAALIRNTSIESGAKAILIKADKKNFLIVFSAKLKFNSKKVKKIVDAKSLRFVEINEVMEITGCLNGAVPPFGSLFEIPTLVDESLFIQGDNISFNAGLRTHSMIISTEDYKKIENPRILNFCDL